MDKKQFDNLGIMSLPYGGYVVYSITRDHGIYPNIYLFAGALSEALTMIKDLLTFDEGQKSES